MALLLKYTCLANRQLGIRFSVFTPRYLSNGVQKEPRINDQDELAAPEGPHQIYEGLLTSQVRRIKRFTLLTSIMGLGMQPVLYEKMSSSGSIPLTIAAASIIGVFTFFTPFLIHYVTKKYVTEIVYDPITEKYTASVFNFIPTKKQIHFKLADVTVPDMPGTFTTLHVRDVPLFCVPPDFTYPEHYAKFMGYDKPIDLKIGLKDNSEKSNQE